MSVSTAVTTAVTKQAPTMSHSIARKARIFLNRVESLIANRTPTGVEKSFVINDVHPNERESVIDIILNQYQDDTGFYLTKQPKYDKHSYELTIHGMFHDEECYGDDTYEDEDEDY